MYVDFINFNKACMNDNFPFSRIDTLIDSMTSHQILRFMDALSGYN